MLHIGKSTHIVVFVRFAISVFR
ncbi:hypothetical protein EZS27_036757, partial [termite gut metagenome]